MNGKGFRNVVIVLVCQNEKGEVKWKMEKTECGGSGVENDDGRSISKTVNLTKAESEVGVIGRGSSGIENGQEAIHMEWLLDIITRSSSVSRMDH
jgi:hypothetical protein